VVTGTGLCASATRDTVVLAAAFNDIICLDPAAASETRAAEITGSP